MQSKEHYCTFPIDSGNQANRNAPPVEINIRFFVIIYTPVFSIFVVTSDDADSTPEHNVCWTSSQTKCQRGSAIHEQ